MLSELRARTAGIEPATSVSRRRSPRSSCALHHRQSLVVHSWRFDGNGDGGVLVRVVEADLLQRRTGFDIDRHFFHLFPGRAVLVRVTRALVDLERQADKLIERESAESNLLGLAVSAHDQGVRAGLAQRIVTDRGPIFDANGAHKQTLSNRHVAGVSKQEAGEQDDTVLPMLYPSELHALACMARLELATVGLCEVTVIYTTGPYAEGTVVNGGGFLTGSSGSRHHSALLFTEGTSDIAVWFRSERSNRSLHHSVNAFELRDCA